MRSAIKQFSSDTKGTFGILLGLLLLPMTLSVLMGMEYFRLVEFRDKLDSVATQVAMASAGGKERSETQRLSDGRLLLTRVMAQQDVKEILSTQGAEPTTSTPQQFIDYVKQETALYAKIIKTANIRIEQ